MDIAALDNRDERRLAARVAGPTALLIAKAHKIQDRLAPGVRLDRLVDKDASDVYRLMLTTPPERITEVLPCCSTASASPGRPSVASSSSEHRSGRLRRVRRRAPIAAPVLLERGAGHIMNTAPGCRRDSTASSTTWPLTDRPARGAWRLRRIG